MCQQSPSLPSKTRNVHSNNYICQRVVVINIYADCSLDRKWQKMTQHFFASVSAQRGWGTMCVSVIHFTASQLSYSCEEEDRPHLIQTGRLWELGGGREHTGFFFFLHSHVTCPPCTLCRSRLSLLQCCWRRVECWEHPICPHSQIWCTRGVRQLYQWWIKQAEQVVREGKQTKASTTN